jgi:ribosomal protein L29
MAVLRSKDIAKMSAKEIEEKLKELKMELIKNKVSLGKGGKLKIREIKKTIARLLTLNNLTISNFDNSSTEKSKLSNKTISKTGDPIKEIVYKKINNTPKKSN